jgi:hypothetical protein
MVKVMIKVRSEIFYTFVVAVSSSHTGTFL